MRGPATLPSWSCPLQSASKWGGLAPTSSTWFCRSIVYHENIMSVKITIILTPGRARRYFYFESSAENSTNSTHSNYSIERDR